MNRRCFLSFIGLAPVAAVLPAMALPRPDNVKDTVRPTVDMDFSWERTLQSYQSLLATKYEGDGG